MSSGLLALAVASAAWPWATGLFTWYEQRLLDSYVTDQFGSVARKYEAKTPRQRPTLKATPWDTWQSEDAAYWRQLAEGGAFGKIDIPKIGVSMTIVKGTSREDLKKGPGWITSTDMPGPKGNAVISGHRTTYLAPFRRIDELHSGDRIDVRSPFRVYHYVVTRQFVVKPTDIQVLRSSVAPILTLTACHPPYTADSRLIVRAKLVKVDVLPAAR